MFGLSTQANSVLRLRDFRLLISARLLWSLGQQVFNLAVSLLVFDRTGSPLALGMIGLTSFMPGLCLTLVSGPVADRIDRRLISCACMAMVACASVLILILGAKLNVIWLYLAVGLLGAARAFVSPALSALLPNVATLEYLNSGLAWSNSLTQVANIGGPMIGGLLYGVSPMFPFWVCATFFSLGAVLIFSIRPRPPQPGKPMDWETLIAGYRYIWSRPVILGAITLDLAAVVLGGAVALLPIYATDIFHAGPEVVGALRAANAVGALAAAIFIAFRPLRGKTGMTMFVCVIVFGLATVGFGLSKTVAPALGFLFILGVADQISVVIRQTLVQIQTPDEMRGRVSAAFAVVTDASNQIGQFESGLAARLFGTVASVVLGGAGSVAIAFLWMKWFPSLRKYDKFH